MGIGLVIIADKSDVDGIMESLKTWVRKHIIGDVVADEGGIELCQK